ncbi:uncharacterized protein [Aegilops tauschii subsp. strangulata]|uniref:uncharacterized protein n=1 Tax=Aegilops tauschii subsp. strangulata TaxID=200361 RepID=UPI003CC8BD85
MGKRFRFEAFWPKADGFRTVVEAAWASVPSVGNPFMVLDNKLKATAKSLQRWSDKWIGHVKMQIALALELILRLDVAMETRQLSAQEFGLRKILKRKLLGLCSLKRSIAHHRSRMTWLRDGDAGSQFFKQHASHRRRWNTIMGLQCNDQYLTGQDEIAEAVDGYFQGILGSAPQRTGSINLDILGLPRLDLTNLELPFSEDEVANILKSMPKDKALGLDGFT